MNKLIRNYPPVLFIILLFAISFVYQYQDIVFKRPQSIHKWRQADGASIALNYYQGGMHFFKPEVHNLTSDSGRSGKCLPSEVPVLYYTVAALYKIFGYHDWIYRGLNTLIFFLGLFFLFKLLRYLLKDIFWAIFLPLLLFTSPVLVYYANNYLVNSTALALSLVGWYYFTRFLFEHKNKWLYISLLFFSLAALLKVTALFSLLAIGFIYLLEQFKLKTFNQQNKIFSTPFKFLIPASLIVIITALWLKHVHDYNIAHDCTYFSTTVFPIWNMHLDEIHWVLDNIKNIWLEQYFHISMFAFLAICFFFIVFRSKKTNAFFFYILFAVFIQIAVYVLFQFRQFADHDYYAVDLFILPVLLILLAFDLLKNEFQKVFHSPVSKGVVLLLLAFNIHHAQSKVADRYNGPVNDYPANKDFYSVTSYLREIGITPADTIISIPDFTHVSLYLMNQKGWTEFYDTRLNSGHPVIYNSDSAGIQRSINKGAKYLIINGIEELYKKPYLQSFATSLVGRYNKILIFKLKDKKDNFHLEKRKIKERFFCDAENISTDKENFISNGVEFKFGKAQSDSFAFSGKYSCRLDKNNPYGMTVVLKGQQIGEGFLITAWSKIDPLAKSSIIASGGSYYNNEYKVIESKNGWEKLSKEFFVTPELIGKELVIYVYNDGGNPSYFDDFEILHYASFGDSTKH